VALVIGNGAYRDAARLTNPINDAQDIAAALTRLDFDVTLKTELSIASFSQAVTDFAIKARGADVALFYFSGHGLQLNAVNYLMPVDAKLENELDVKLQTISAQDIIELMERSARMNLVFLDACRDNPIAERLYANLHASGKSAGASKGLARIADRGGETLIVYAAEAGKVALDGTTRNSPFAAAVLKHMPSPALEVEVMLKRVTADVLKATANKQQPERVSRLVSEFYFRNALMVLPDRPEPPPRPPREPPKASPERPPAEAFDGKRAPAPLTPAEEAALRPRAAFQECVGCPILVVVPSGRFMMGSPETQLGHRSDEHPQHLVTFAKSFAVGRFEVTVAQYVEFLNDSAERGRLDERWVATAPKESQAPILRSDEGARPHFTVKPGQEEYPVTYVSWRGASDYASWLSRRTEAPYRLLSEAEWEYAARGGSTTVFPFGDDGLKLCDHGNVADLSGMKKFEWSRATDCEDGYPALAPVGKFQPNGFGLYDMIGNAAEWVEDCLHPNYDGAPNDGSAWIAGGACHTRSVRGGSFDTLSIGQRSAKRFQAQVYSRFNTIGFRVARSFQP
jgi:formylglycine-generating enzyme required for sulfatase activity